MTVRASTKAQYSLNRVESLLTVPWATARMRPPCPARPGDAPITTARLLLSRIPQLWGRKWPGKLSVSVDHNLCVGNQMCISIATKALTLNDDRQAIPADVDADTEEIIIEAAEQCPMAAISVMVAETGEQLFP